MFALPFGDDHFDVATVQRIWKVGGALQEAPPGGTAPAGWPVQLLRSSSLAWARCWRRCSNSPEPIMPMPPSTRVTPGGPAWPSRCSPTPGLEFADRGAAQVVNEWPDLDLAVRALASAGPSWPAWQAVQATTGSPAGSARRSARSTPKVSASASSPSSAGSWGGSPAADVSGLGPAGGSRRARPHETVCSQPLTVHVTGQHALKIAVTCIVP